MENKIKIKSDAQRKLDEALAREGVKKNTKKVKYKKERK